MTGRLEAVDARGYLHAIAASRALGGVHGYMCTCGAWRMRSKFAEHLEELGASTTPPALPRIDAEMCARAKAAGKIAAGVYGSAALDIDGFVVCKCRMPFPAWDDWGDHYADAVLAGALNEIST